MTVNLINLRLTYLKFWETRGNKYAPLTLKKVHNCIKNQIVLLELSFLDIHMCSFQKPTVEQGPQFVGKFALAAVNRYWKT